ncbi:MAG: rhodanese-like domain-containing protein [Saprospiraceae bacterium]|jgi:rhodanese-related sulfurtransferase|nr:rhodanese-like domain-containing protein [Saprospiraceae bacterium]MBP9209592.1 rhodanese-like domain-containing protein [Saprospiraceae bacterium]MBV6472542.1 Sulfurtransferase [Saprospiraceae bacterium]
MEDISVNELRQRLDRGERIRLVDVREAYEHDEFNIGGELMPLGALIPEHLDALRGDEDTEIVLYCRSGNRSGVAKTLLAMAGFTRVRNLLGGMLEWQGIDPSEA